MRSMKSIAAGAALVLGFSGALSHQLRGPEPRAEPTVAGRVADGLARPLPVAPKLRYTEAMATAVAEKKDARLVMVENAEAALARRVVEKSHPDALRMAFQAYYAYKAKHPEKVRKPYFYYVDYGLDNRTPRGYVFDMAKLTVVDGPFMVAHGRGSGAEGVPTRFSNRNGSNATSLGLYLTQETYGFSGKSGGRRYTSVGLRMQGLSGEYNSAARSRGVVVHGAPYVSASRAGRSEGCPAMEQFRARTLLPKIAHGSLVFHFSPRDASWMRQDRWAAAEFGKLALGDG